MAAGVSGDRPLSPRGIADLRRLGGHLGARGWRPDRVLASPLARARESASTVLEAAGLALPVEILAALDPARAGPEALLEALAGLDCGRALLVGHQPLLGQLAFRLTGSEVPFVPAGLASIECSQGWAAGSGRLVETLAPGAGY